MSLGIYDPAIYDPAIYDTGGPIVGVDSFIPRGSIATPTMPGMPTVSAISVPDFDGEVAVPSFEATPDD